MSAAPTNLADQQFLERLVTAADVAGVTASELAQAGSSTFTSTEPGISAIDVKVNTGHVSGLLSRFRVENNLNQPTTDVNLRGVNVNIGNTDAAVSPAGTQVQMYKPTGDTSQHITWFRPGSTTLPAGYIGPSGQLVLAVGGLSSTALSVRVYGDANDKFKIDENGVHSWGAGGASAVDTNLYRETTNRLKTDGGLRVLGGVSAGNLSPTTDQLKANDAITNRPSGALTQMGANGPSTAASFQWGTGGSADCMVYRSAAKVLTSDSSIVISGTTTYFMPPVLTTTQRDALTAVEGMVIYNSTTHKLNVRAAAAWEAVTSA